MVKVTDEQRVAAAASGPEKRIIPLAGGTWAYVVDPVSQKLAHVAVASDEFDRIIAAQSALSPAYAARLKDELGRLGYGDVPAAVERLAAAGVFGGEQEG